MRHQLLEVRVEVRVEALLEALPEALHRKGVWDGSVDYSVREPGVERLMAVGSLTGVLADCVNKRPNPKNYKNTRDGREKWKTDREKYYNVFDEDEEGVPLPKELPHNPLSMELRGRVRPEDEAFGGLAGTRLPPKTRSASTRRR